MLRHRVRRARSDGARRRSPTAAALDRADPRACRDRCGLDRSPERLQLKRLRLRHGPHSRVRRIPASTAAIAGRLTRTRLTLGPMRSGDRRRALGDVTRTQVRSASAAQERGYRLRRRRHGWKPASDAPLHVSAATVRRPGSPAGPRFQEAAAQLRQHVSFRAWHSMRAKSPADEKRSAGSFAIA